MIMKYLPLSIYLGDFSYILIRNKLNILLILPNIALENGCQIEYSFIASLYQYAVGLYYSKAPWICW